MPEITVSTSQIDLIKLANSLTICEAQNLFKILQSRLNRGGDASSFYTSSLFSHSPSSLTITPPPSPPLRKEFISVQEFFSRGFQLHINIDPETFFSLVNDFKINGDFLKHRNKKTPCPLCHRSSFHTCCSRCKRLHLDYRCQYACGLIYPVQFSSDGKATQWKKCSFVTDNYDVQAIIEHLNTCEGKISKDFKLIILKIYYHKEIKGALITKAEEININERHCELCKEIHYMRQACYGEDLGCWSSNSTIVAHSTIWNENSLCNSKISGKKVTWDDSDG
ncbi:4132_t:CDS:1, partial [Dentiscutata heterogama]